MAEVATDHREPSTQAFTEDSARAALTRACQSVDVECRFAELIRMGSNAVFRLDPGLIARVAPTVALRANAEKQVAVAHWLAAADYPAVRAAPVPQPVEACGRIVTFWKSISRDKAYAPIADVASLIKRLHSLASPTDLVLPELQPFGSVEDTPRFSGLATEDARFLRERIEWAREYFTSLPYILPRGIIHGDANVGNVICDDRGRAVLIDLDSFAVGPREWDLIQTALFFDRLGWHSAEEYRTFVAVYGYDITEWAGYSDLADMREIAMTSWLGKKADTSPAAATETAKRVEAIRTGCSRRDWGAH